MIDATADWEVKSCCATFYQSDIVRALLGDVLHPGGLALTQHLGESIGLGPNDRVLDVACGRGASAIHLAHRFRCHVTGVDYGEANITVAATEAVDRGLTGLTTFRRGDAEGLSLDGGAFDAVISECSFCTFPDKVLAAREMVRVLRSGGRLGLTDVTARGRLSRDLQPLLAWVACVGGAATSEEYVMTLQEAGFSDVVAEDCSEALVAMVTEVRRKLMAVELVAGLGNLPGVAPLAKALGGIDLDQIKRLTQQVLGYIDRGDLGYTMITAAKR